MFIIGVKSMPIQLQTNVFGMGSKSHDLFGVDWMILRISSADIIWKEINLFL